MAAASHMAMSMLLGVSTSLVVPTTLAVSTRAIATIHITSDIEANALSHKRVAQAAFAVIVIYPLVAAKLAIADLPVISSIFLKSTNSSISRSPTVSASHQANNRLYHYN